MAGFVAWVKWIIPFPLWVICITNISPYITKAKLESQAKNQLPTSLKAQEPFPEVRFLRFAVIQMYLTLKSNRFFYIFASGLELTYAFEKFLLLHAL